MNEEIHYTLDEKGYRVFDSIYDLRLAIGQAVKNYHHINGDTTDDFLFYQIYHNIPNKFWMHDNGTGFMKDPLDPRVFEYENEKDLNVKESLNKEIYNNPVGEIDVNTTYKNLMELYKDNYALYKVGNRIFFFTNDFLASSRCGDTITIYTRFDNVPDNVRQAFVYKEVDGECATYKYVIHSQNGFTTARMDVKHLDTDIEIHYNDDLPHEKITKFLDSDDAGLLIFNGEPGTGKSSYIRYLIETMPDSNFMILDSSVFNYITDASFIELLLENPNSIVILEDCEHMISERTENKNLSTLLNLTDGIIGDSFNLKFICTFNTDIKNIDKALLRKGRLKTKYEFKKLTPEKTQELAKKFNVAVKEGESMTLTDIINAAEDTGAVVKSRKSIGFTLDNGSNKGYVFRPEWSESND